MRRLLPEPPPTDDIMMEYYAVLSKDFNDDEFERRLGRVIRNSFKFPPVAAFYKEDPQQEPQTFEPVTPEEARQIKLAREQHGF